MAVVYVNNQPVDIGNEKLNLVQAALKGGVFIPHYCWHPALTVVASCRMCLVEAGERKPDGSIAMQPRVVPACQTPAKDGTVIVTNSQRARDAQMQTLESLLLNHPLDCPVCDKAGECLLQDFSYNFGRSQSRMVDEKNTPPNKPYISDTISLFTDRCIMCSRCVRFTREVSGTAELQVINRGNHSEIDIFPGEPLNNKLAGNVVDLCPVGALCSKDFLYKQRVWFLKSQKSVCADCSTGCSIFVDHNKDIVYRLRPRENPEAQGYFMCDEGRYGFHYANSEQRILRPLLRGNAQANGAPTPTSYEEVLPALLQELLELAKGDGAAVAAVLSPFLTCEEAYLLATYFKQLSPQARLALGPVPVVGADDTYPKDRHGRPVQPVRFTIHAEKCPNRRGVEAVLRHFQGDVIGFEQILHEAGTSKLQALYIAAGYPPRAGGWISPAQAEALKLVPLVVVQDLFASPASELAKYVLPAAPFAEKDGTFVNHQGLAQAVHWAVRPPQGLRTDGQVFLNLLDRRGLWHAPSLRAELAHAVAYFAPLAERDLGEHGVLLEPAK
ncbi:MAG: 2Fe-2S iron-sulfur cluster binding domain-containing protein [Planctomycetota bacterium]|nr:MAG: 2Fe-2S iron-sulfur cluster binding domain-containing protein [Planctomycetota bacterium]